MMNTKRHTKTKNKREERSDQNNGRPHTKKQAIPASLSETHQVYLGNETGVVATIYSTRDVPK